MEQDAAFYAQLQAEVLEPCAEEGGEVSGRPAALPSPRVASDGPNRDPFATRRSSDWSGKPSQVRPHSVRKC